MYGDVEATMPASPLFLTLLGVDLDWKAHTCLLHRRYQKMVPEAARHAVRCY